MTPPAPAWLSMKNDWPIARDNRSPRMRATMSTPPPGACGAMIFTGRLGYACASAPGPMAIARQAARSAAPIRLPRDPSVIVVIDFLTVVGKPMLPKGLERGDHRLRHLLR